MYTENMLRVFQDRNDAYEVMIEVKLGTKYASEAAHFKMKTAKQTGAKIAGVYARLNAVMLTIEGSMLSLTEEGPTYRSSCYFRGNDGL